MLGIGARWGRRYVKGAPEAIGRLCIAETLPADFAAVVAAYSVRGLRVLGLGG